MMKNTGVLLLTLGAFVAGTAELVVGGVLRPIADDLGVSIALAGQLITAFSLAFALGTPIVVALTSRAGCKTMLIYSLAVFALGNLISFLSQDFGMILFSRAVVGLAVGVFTVVAFGAAAKLVAPAQVGKAVGTIALGVSVSMVIGIPLVSLAATLALLPALGGAAIPALAVLLLWMFSMALVIPAIQTYFIQQAPDRSNLVIGLNTSILHLGVAAGAGIGGLAAEAAASVQYHPWMASVAAVLSLIMAVVSVSRSQAAERVGKRNASLEPR
ncbi:MFS transporter [Cohnella sp.]|uniref:MFS transporter n=1 Tax=Cohnella sp. TaxID=1883426 RepID=UPI0035625CC2